MNSIRRVLTALVVFVCILDTFNQAKGFDISETFVLERYTILQNGTVQYDQGNLLKNGQFRVFLSEIPDLFGSIETFEPISGRPIMLEGLFDGYKASGVIPKWVRSRDSYPIGLSAYVIVSVVGGLDPNPIPTILDQPQSQSVLLGDFAFFYVDVSPVTGVSYQWLFKNKPIPGETSSLLIVNDVGRAQAGIYTVAVNMGGQNVISDRAVLRLVMPVTIKTQPRSQTIAAGRKAAFRVAVQGTKPFTYQWYFNNATIPQATNLSYSISQVQGTDAGRYFVIVSNGLSSQVSSNAVLTVSP